jgi:hypothetical protein
MERDRVSFPRKGSACSRCNAPPIAERAGDHGGVLLRRVPAVFLVWLVDSSHRPPYTAEQPQFGIVERSVVAFLDHYLDRLSLVAFERAARRLTRLVADPLNGGPNRSVGR